MSAWVKWWELEQSPYHHTVTLGKVNPEYINGGTQMSDKPMLILWALDCGHLATAYANNTETKLHCIYHNEERTVIGVHVFEWHVFCTQPMGKRKCTFSRWSGTSKDNANMLGNHHSRNNPSHAASIRLEYVMRAEAVDVQRKWTLNELGA